VTQNDGGAEGAGADATLQAEVEASPVGPMGGRKEILTVGFDQAGASVTRLSKAMSEARREAGYLAGDFLKNTAKVTLWAASVGVLYKSIEMASYSMSRLIDVGAQRRDWTRCFAGLGGRRGS